MITTLSLKVMGVIDGTYKPSTDEIPILTEVAKLNKLYLAFIRHVSEIPRHERLLEESRFRLFMKHVTDVVKVLKGLRYALFKFRKPIDYVPSDLDILIHGNDVSEAVKRLMSIGFSIDVIEPYTVTLKKKNFIVDLYIHPSIAWVVYMDGQKLLEDYSEDVEVNDVLARCLTKDAEVVVSIAHAIYKEHLVLLLDYLTIRKWFSRRVLEIAIEFNVEEALEIALSVCRAVEEGIIEVPYKVPLPYITKLYVSKVIKDPWFRGTSVNILKYLARERSGRITLWRLKRRSY